MGTYLTEANISGISIYDPVVILTAAAVLAAVVLFLSLSVLSGKRKEKGNLIRGMNLSLFLVSIPQESKNEKEKQAPLEEYIKIAEQFYSSLSGLKDWGSLKSLGNPYFIFEIAVHRIGEEICFYFACPKDSSQLLEKQISAFWPKAQVQFTEDYNIFNPDGVSLGSEAVLTKTSLLPLKNYQELKMDPLSSLTSVLTKLEKEGEGAAIQIILRPSKKTLKNKALKVADLAQKGVKLETAIAKAQKGFIGEMADEAMASPAKKDQENRNISQRQNPMQDEIISNISKKGSSLLFDVNLRVLSSAKNEAKAEIILEQLKSAFLQFNSPILNSLKFKNLSGRSLKKLFYKFSFRIFSEKETMLLSTGELAGIFHFPQGGLATPNIKWLKTKQAPAPANLPQSGIVVGKNIYRSEEKKVYMQEADRLRHFYIIGQTGTGKSVFLKELIKQDIEEGRGVAFIDPHGDSAEEVLSLVPAQRAEDVIYFNPSDTELPLGLNMLEYDPKFPESKTFVVNELLEIFEKLYNLKTQGFGGPMFEQYMRNALLLVMEDPASGNTLVEAPKVLADANFRKYKLSKCKNIVVKNFWEQEAEKAGGEAALANMVPYITSKMNVFIANDMVRPIISQQKSAFNMREIMDQNKILIVNLAKGKLGDINSYLLGMIIVGKILLAAFSRSDIPEEKRKNFFLYVDEFQNVTTKTVPAILSEARKYRLAMIFAHQFIGQLDEDTRKAVFGNVGSMLTFRIGPDDAKYLVTQYEPVFDENDLVNLDNYNGALRLLINGQTSKPFNIKTFAPAEGNFEIANLIKELSRKKYGRNKALVEAELYERLKTKFSVNI